MKTYFLFGFIAKLNCWPFKPSLNHSPSLYSKSIREFLCGLVRRRSKRVLIAFNRRKYLFKAWSTYFLCAMNSKISFKAQDGVHGVSRIIYVISTNEMKLKREACFVYPDLGTLLMENYILVKFVVRRLVCRPDIGQCISVTVVLH